MSEQEQTPVEGTPRPELNGHWIDDEGKFLDGWREKLPDGLGEHSSLEKYNNIADLIKGTVNANKLVGQKAEEFYTSEDPEVIARRNEIMGVPKDASEYTYEQGELPEGMPTELITKRMDEFKEFAKELGIPKDKAKQLMEWDLKGAAEQFEGMAEQAQIQKNEAEEALRKEWKGDKFEYNVAKVAEAMDYLGLGEYKDDARYANDPAFVKAIFDKVVPLISDDSIIEGRQAENYATLNDSWTHHRTKMYDYLDNGGSQQDAIYKNMMKVNEEFASKISKNS